MALYRTISMSFWTDSKIIDDFTPEDRYFYLYLFTNPHTNLCGCYEISFRQMVVEVGYSRESIENLVRRFEEYHKVISYSKETKEILLLNWWKHNWTKSDKYVSALKSEIEKVKEPAFRSYLYDALFKQGCGVEPVAEKAKPQRDTLAERFDTLWKMYPRKQGKKAAFESYKRAVKAGATDEEITAGITAYCNYIQASQIEPQYVKQGSTFFSQRAWADDWTPVRKRDKYAQRIDDVSNWGKQFEEQISG